MEQIGRGLWAHTFLDAEGSTTNGVWVDVSRFDSINVEILKIGTPTFSVDIRATLSIIKPENTDHCNKVGNSLTDNALYEITAPIKWLKLYVSANNGDADNYIDGRILCREKRP